MALNYITRHTVPTKYDTAPYGTLCYSMKDEDEYKLFIQLSTIEEARWEPIGYLLEMAFEEKLDNEEFINEILNLSTCTSEKSFSTLSKILK